jgi:hypothetical protein
MWTPYFEWSFLCAMILSNEASYIAIFPEMLVKVIKRFQRMVYERMGESWILLIDRKGAESSESIGMKLSLLSAVVTSRTSSARSEEDSRKVSIDAWRTFAADGKRTALEIDGAFSVIMHRVMDQ